jgi:hypothetical protein
VSQLEALLDVFVVTRPDIFEQPQHLCLDKGYRGEAALEMVALRGFIPHIKGRGAEKAEKKNNSEYNARAGLLKSLIPG